MTHPLNLSFFYLLSVEETYTKLMLIEHILKRLDTYVGLIKADAVDDDDDDFVYKKSGHWEICIAPSVEGHFQQVSNSIFIYMIVCLFICLFIHSFIFFLP